MSTVNNKQKRFVKKVTFNGLQKRYKPNKHYVFILQVYWSDNTEYIIYRTYGQFYNLHCTLMDRFPIEAGEIDPSQRSLPSLPGRRIFRRSEIQTIAEKRKETLGDYCSDLLQLDKKISQCPIVFEFFEAHEKDLNPPKDCLEKRSRSLLVSALAPLKGKFQTTKNHGFEEMTISEPLMPERYRAIADYSAEGKTEISLTVGMTVEIVEKHENGWWFVQGDAKQGWAPASYLEPTETAIEQDEPEINLDGEIHITIQAYKAKYDDEISFEKGVMVDVMHKLLDGWWIVSYQGDAGYAPAAYLRVYTNPHLKKSPRPSPLLTKKFGIIPRKKSIENKNSKWLKPQRDLTIYRKISDSKRRKKLAKQNKLLEEGDSSDDDYDFMYENEGFINSLHASHMSKKPAVQEDESEDIIIHVPDLTQPINSAAVISDDSNFLQVTGVTSTESVADEIEPEQYIENETDGHSTGNASSIQHLEEIEEEREEEDSSSDEIELYDVPRSAAPPVLPPKTSKLDSTGYEVQHYSDDDNDDDDEDSGPDDRSDYDEDITQWRANVMHAKSNLPMKSQQKQTT